MGQLITPKYRIVIEETTKKGDYRRHQMVWRGKPTEDNLIKYIKEYAKSLELGGVNERISKKLGFIPYPTSAWIVNQKTNKIMCRWQAAPFQIW